jgi:hypothetical protein
MKDCLVIDLTLAQLSNRQHTIPFRVFDTNAASRLNVSLEYLGKGAFTRRFINSMRRYKPSHNRPSDVALYEAGQDLIHLGILVMENLDDFSLQMKRGAIPVLSV